MKYEQPIMNIIRFEIVDVIVTSQIQDSTWNPNKDNENINGEEF